MRKGIYILLMLILALSLYAGLFAGDEAYYKAEQINDCLKWLAISLLLYLLKFKYHLILSAGVFLMCAVELIDEYTGKNIKNLPVYYNDYVMAVLSIICITIVSFITWLKSKKNS